MRSFHGKLYRDLWIWAATLENRFSGFPTRSDTNRAVQPQNIARGLKFRIEEEDGLYYLCSGYCTADLRLCFHICKKADFSLLGSCNEVDNMHALVYLGVWYDITVPLSSHVLLISNSKGIRYLEHANENKLLQKIKNMCTNVLRKPPTHYRLLTSCNLMHINLIIKNTVCCYMLSENSSHNLEYDSKSK